MGVEDVALTEELLAAEDDNNNATGFTDEEKRAIFDEFDCNPKV